MLGVPGKEAWLGSVSNVGLHQHAVHAVCSVPVFAMQGQVTDVSASTGCCAAGYDCFLLMQSFC
jgi:hypothetical protein